MRKYSLYYYLFNSIRRQDSGRSVSSNAFNRPIRDPDLNPDTLVGLVDSKCVQQVWAGR